MRGCGSGFQGARKVTVEDGLTLSLSAMLEKGALVPGSMTSGSWHRSYPGHEPHARIRCLGNMVDLDNASIAPDYRVNETVRYGVRLVSSVPRFGGRRTAKRNEVSRSRT